MGENQQPPRVRKLSAPLDVPVYNCPVFVAGPEADGTFVARSATLKEVTARGASEREALQNIVAAFKAEVARYSENATPIPWLDPPLPPKGNERQRLIAVHL